MSAAPLFVNARIVISSSAKLLSVLRQSIANLTLELGWDESESRAITLAFEEALTNKIRHAYGSRPGEKITVEIHTEDKPLVFRLTDQGVPPDPARICARDEDSMTAGGFGTQIMRDVMDKVDYITVPEGNQVILTKYLPVGGNISEVSP